MTEISRTPNHQAVPRSDIGVAWFVRRAIAAVVIWCVSIGGVAWLLHASIDPTLDANAAETLINDQAIHVTGSLSKR